MTAPESVTPLWLARRDAFAHHAPPNEGDDKPTTRIPTMLDTAGLTMSPAGGHRDSNGA